MDHEDDHERTGSSFLGQILQIFWTSAALFVTYQFFVFFYDFHLNWFFEPPIKTWIAYDLNECPRERPLLIGMLNTEDQAIVMKSFGIEARQDGLSEPVLSVGRGTYEVDQVFQPIESRLDCWSLSTRIPSTQLIQVMNMDPESLEWSVSAVSWEKAID